MDMEGKRGQEGDNVLIVWRSIADEGLMKALVLEVETAVGPKGSVAVENFDRLLDSSHKSSHFNLILNGFLGNESQMVGEDLLAEMARILKPEGKLILDKSQREDCSTQKFMSTLKLSGFVNLQETKDCITAFKSSYEIGSGVRLPFAGPAKSGPKAETLKIWQLAAEGEEEEGEELVSQEDLLDDDDLKKPDPASLKVCASTGKRKACTNCSCGLAEELENSAIDEIKKNSQNAKSSCGSCYLGDAFRCASCPYLGMPAFKPGEKVVIDTSSDL